MTVNQTTVALEQPGAFWMDGSDFHFTALGVSDDFACEYVMDTLIPRVPNTALTFRHRHSLQSPNDILPIFGWGVKASKVKKQIDGKEKMFLETEFCVPTKAKNGHDLDENIVYSQWVKKCYEEGIPAGISYHFQTQRENGIAYHASILEIAGTPYPKCKQCLVSPPQVDGAVSMNEEEKKQLEKMDSKQLQALLEKLTSDKQSLSLELEKKQKELSDIETKNKTALESEKTRAEKAMDLVENISKEFTALKLELEYASTKKPLVDEIIKLEGDSELGEFYKSKPVDWLKKRLEKVSQPKLQTARLDPGKSMHGARQALEGDEPTTEEVLKNLPSNLAKEYKKLKEGGL